MLEVIYVRKNNQYVKEAALHGIELEALEHKSQQLKANDPENIELIDKTIKEAVNRRLSSNIRNLNVK